MLRVVLEDEGVGRQVPGLLQLPDGLQARLGDHVLVRRQKFLQVLFNENKLITQCSYCTDLVARRTASLGRVKILIESF